MIADVIIGDLGLDILESISPPKLFNHRPEWVFQHPSINLACLEGEKDTEEPIQNLIELREHYLGNFSSSHVYSKQLLYKCKYANKMNLQNQCDFFCFLLVGRFS